jgi:cell division septation protein DedD
MKEHYGILVGSFKNYGDAGKLLGTLKKPGKPAFVQRDPKDLNLFQVWLGPFSSQPEAQAAAKEMQAKLKKPLKIEQIENPVPK